MILLLCVSSRRDAVGDLYKDIINNMDNKKDIIAIIPNSYKKEEFSRDVFLTIRENMSVSQNRFEKIKKNYFFLKNIWHIIKKYKIKNIYIHSEDYFSMLFFLSILIRKMNVTLWFHDPVLHGGSNCYMHVKREIAYYSYLRFFKKLIVSYKDVFNEIRYNKNLLDLSNKFRVLYLPQMKELEFEYIKNDNNLKVSYDFIFFGRIEEYKGLDFLLEAFNDDGLRDINLLIIGRGNKEKEIKKLSLKKNITFINEYVSNKSLAKYIMQSKFVILPYKSATGTQTVQIANYYNKMVLATPVGCFKEYIEEGKNGFFIKNYEVESIKNAILKYKDFNIDELQKKKIYDVYKKFDLKITSQYLYKIIKE